MQCFCWYENGPADINDNITVSVITAMARKVAIEEKVAKEVEKEEVQQV